MNAWHYNHLLTGSDNHTRKSFHSLCSAIIYNGPVPRISTKLPHSQERVNQSSQSGSTASRSESTPWCLRHSHWDMTERVHNLAAETLWRDLSDSVDTVDPFELIRLFLFLWQFTNIGIGLFHRVLRMRVTPSEVYTIWIRASRITSSAAPTGTSSYTTWRSVLVGSWKVWKR